MVFGGRSAWLRVARIALFTGYFLACVVASNAQQLVTDKPVAQSGGTAYVGRYTATSVFSAGPAFHFTGPVSITSVAYDAGLDGARELAVRNLYGCPLNQVIPAGTVCSIDTQIASQYPGWRYGTLRVTTTGGAFTVPVRWESVGSQVVVTPGVLSTPKGAAGLTGTSLAVDARGNIYLSAADSTVRKVDALTGLAAVVAGVAGDSRQDGDGGLATAAHIGAPVSAVVSPAGDVYLVSSAPLADDAVRKIDGGTGVIATVASIYTGRVPTLAASSGQGTDGAVAVDDQGNIYASVTKVGALVVTSGDGSMTRYLVGGPAGQSATCNGGDNFAPTTLAVSGGYVYFASGAAVYKVSTDTTACHTPVLVAGTGTVGNSGDGGLATKAALGLVSGLSVDAAGDVYLADATNNTVRVVSAASGIISTVAGAGSALPSVTVAAGWASLALDVRGNLYVLSAAGEVQKIDVTNSAMTFSRTTVGEQASATKTITVTNGGNAELPVGQAVTTGDFLLGAGSSCGVGNGALLAPGASCAVSVNFRPSVAGELSGLLRVAGIDVPLSGVGMSATAAPKVANGTYSIAVNPGELTLAADGNATAAFVFTPAGSYKGAVSFTCAGLPAGVTCSFSSPTLIADGLDKVQRAQLTLSMRSGHLPVVASGYVSTGLRMASFLGLNTLLLGWLKLRRKGALSLQGLSLLMLMALGVAGATGCGMGGTVSAAHPAVVQAVTIMAAGAGDGTSTSTTFMLTMK